MAFDTESVAIKPQTDYIDTDCIQEQLSLITDLLVIFHLQDTITRVSNQLTIACSCNLCQLYVYVRAYNMCLHNLFQNIIKQLYITIHIDASRAFTLRAKHVTVKSSWKYIILWSLSYVISSQDGTVQECDCTMSYTQEQVSYLTVHVGDCCRVFLLPMMYEGVETAVINLV